MKFAMEMHDSWVREVEHGEDGSGSILFQAYVYRSEGLWDGVGESGWQNVRMKFRGMVVEGPCEVGSYALDGLLSLGGVRDSGLISFPVEYAGPVLLCMTLSDDFGTTEITAEGITVCGEGGFETSESWNKEESGIQATAE